jgi:hypothetical protein
MLVLSTPGGDRRDKTTLLHLAYLEHNLTLVKWIVEMSKLKAERRIPIGVTRYDERSREGKPLAKDVVDIAVENKWWDGALNVCPIHTNNRASCGCGGGEHASNRCAHSLCP